VKPRPWSDRPGGRISNGENEMLYYCHFDYAQCMVQDDKYKFFDSPNSFNTNLIILNSLQDGDEFTLRFYLTDVVPVHTDQGFSAGKNTNRDLFCKWFQNLNANFIGVKYRIDFEIDP
jgi:hypothetical protein